MQTTLNTAASVVRCRTGAASRRTAITCRQAGRQPGQLRRLACSPAALRSAVSTGVHTGLTKCRYECEDRKLCWAQFLIAFRRRRSATSRPRLEGLAEAGESRQGGEGALGSVQRAVTSLLVGSMSLWVRVRAGLTLRSYLPPREVTATRFQPRSERPTDPVTSTQASAAFADDEVVTAVIPSDPTQDLIVSIVFVIAILLLLVLTGGVVYLSYMDWNDRRIEASAHTRRYSSTAAASHSEAPQAASHPRQLVNCACSLY